MDDCGETCGPQNAKGRMQSAKCKMKNAKCKMKDVITIETFLPPLPSPLSPIPAA
jgi:hypothetical protein